MTVTYALTRCEALFVASRQVGRFWGNWISVLLVSTGLTWISSHSFPRDSSPTSKLMAASSVFALVFSALWFFFWIVAIMILLTKLRQLTEERSITISDEGLVQKTPDTVGQVKWSAFRRVKRGRRWLFVCLNSAQWVVVPKRAFASESDWVAFGRQAEEYFARAKA